jgi:glycerol-3-phosphate O-acyltransferase/dihydroxyacetone phosphate acyltransferase
MVYTIIKWLTNITLKAYFRKLVVRGIENIPSEGPVIIAANHPSSFMDPMVIGTFINRSLHFIAAGEFMGRGLKSWIYRKQLHMIPVYRPAVTTGEAVNNEGMFSQCYELLAGGGAIMIFPEGSSVTEKRVRKLKTGMARMALGTRDHSSGAVEVSIVPVGLNYTNPHRFQSEVFVNIGVPVTTKGYSSDPQGVESLTAEVERRLRETVLHVDSEELDSVVKKVEVIMKSGPRVWREKQRIEKFQHRQRIIQAIQAMHDTEPDMIRQLEVKLDAYLGKIRQLGISDRSIAVLSPLSTSWERFRLYGGKPLFAVGYLINALPYFLTVFVFRMLKLFPRADAPPAKQRVNPAFRGSVGIVIGMGVFILWYLGWAVGLVLFTGLWWVGLAALVFFYLTGLFTLRYIGWTLIADQKSRVRKLLGEGTDVYSGLIVDRKEILDAINKMTQEFQTN